MAGQLAIIHTYAEDLDQETSVTAVHETRKAIRRTFSAIKLFRPYFEPGLLDGYRRRLRKLMKRLEPCRDTAVFLGKLRDYAINAPIPLDELAAYWQTRLETANANLRVYRQRPQWAVFWDEYAAFTTTPDQGALPVRFGVPIRVRHLMPVLLYQRAADVLAYDDYVNGDEPLSVEMLHKIRIRCKELRYTFQFFTPLLGAEIGDVIDVLKWLQVNLGDLNDARVALAMLDGLEPETAVTASLNTAVVHYKKVQQAEINRLLTEFHPLWAALNAPQWRKNLAAAIAA